MKLFRRLQPLWEPFVKSASSVYASSACFYILLSLLPALLLILSVLPHLPIEELWTLLPPAFHPIGTYLLDLIADADGLAWISAVVTLWSASKGTLAISDGLNAVMHYKREPSYLRRRFHAMGAFLLFLGALAIFLFLLTDDNTIIILPALWFFFSLLYWLLPKGSLPLRICCLGALLPTLGWVILTWLFSIYVSHFSSYQELYGSAGLLLLAAIWLHWCILMVLYGGLLSRLLLEGSYHPISLLRRFFHDLFI